MQSVRLVVRQVGLPDPQRDIISPDELNEYIQYQLTSNGYKLVGVPNYLGPVREGERVLGWQFALWFTLDQEPEPVRPKSK